MLKNTLAITGVVATLMAATFTPEAVAAELHVTAKVDTAVCASVPIQCSQNGHNYAAASDANHNPIRLFVQVVQGNGLPMTGLTSSDFSFSGAFAPAGGGAAGMCSDAICGSSWFIAGSNGLYQIFLDLLPAGNWKAGAYAGTIRVTIPGTDNGSSLVTFTIPKARQL